MNEYQHQDLISTLRDAPAANPAPSESGAPPANPPSGGAQQPFPFPAPGGPTPYAAAPVAFAPAPAPFVATKRMKAAFIAALALCVMIANFVFLNGFALGFSVTVLLAQFALFGVLPKPANQKAFSASLFFGAAVVALGASFTLFSDGLLGFLNFNVLTALFILEMLLYSEALPFEWDTPAFFIEWILTPFVRPFISLVSVWKVGKSFALKKGMQANPDAERRNPAFLKVLIGLLIALPVTAVIILLLASADPVFRNIFRSIVDFIDLTTAQEAFSTVILAVLCFPFLCSVMLSCLTRWKLQAGVRETSGSESPRFRLDSVILSTVLGCVNVIYAIFTAVQFSALFGAFSMTLPDGLTYAQYARQGFFQLCAVAFLNLVMVVLSVLFMQRRGVSGKIARILSVLMIFFTFILLISAGYRMKMYIDVFALSKLRVLVCIFMGLIAILLILALMKEFLPKFKFFKPSVTAAVLVLLFTNYVNPNAQIARYNTERYLENRISLGEETSSSKNASPEENIDVIDVRYLTDELSYDAIPWVLPLLNAKDPAIASAAKKRILEIYEYQLKDYGGEDWRRLNISTENAKKAIEEYFGTRLEKELESVR